MNSERPPIRGIDLALALGNTIDMMNNPPDFLVTQDRLREFLLRMGYPEAASKVSEDEFQRVLLLRARLEEALDASEREAAAMLNALSVEWHAHARIAREGEGWRLEHGPEPAAGPLFLGAAATVPLLELLAAGDWERVARCTGSPCCCLFIDRSRNRSRKYCCKLCADRVNQADYRHRRRGSTVHRT